MHKIFRIIYVTGIVATSLLGQFRQHIPDTQWKLWPDTAASWENDRLYLPDRVNLDSIAINPPTGGWEVLSSDVGKTITLPATVEQYYWGEFGYRPYTNEYYFEKDDPQVKNGNYKGVSWWWREINIPAGWEEKKILLHIRGARLRAELYLNQKLVGYHLITETAFTCDLTAAAKPGKKNILAIRITNPGGEMDWMDTKLHQWGQYEFHMGHGFGGLDRGLFISAHDPVYLEDSWILNTPDIKTIIINTNIKNDNPFSSRGKLRVDIIDPETNDTIIKEEISFEIEGNSLQRQSKKISCPEADVWSIAKPQLYKIKINLIAFPGNGGGEYRDSMEKTFGFRWFDVTGIGKNAILRLNYQRIRLISAISWGFWGFNGLWPTPELAVREVEAAKAFGMNCINFHRNIGKAEIFNVQDSLGLLRFMEPGGGQSALGSRFSLYAKSPQIFVDKSGNGGLPVSFAEKYMEEKIIRMIRDHRSHPSLIIYCIQNEIHPDLQNPRIYHLLRRMHQEDPSRIIVLKSGIPPKNQAWMLPFDDTIHIDKGNGYSGWWDRHTVGGPGIWQDQMYLNPQEFTHSSVNDSEIVIWGEMLGAAVPDNHPRMIKEIINSGGNSYDLKDHQEILEAYTIFLDKWGFRKSFPTNEGLFLDIGNKSYDFWGRVIETARLSEQNDFLIISGWESTAMENHSGLLDNLRNYKGDPSLLKTRFANLRPVIKARALVAATGDIDTLDLFLLNETNAPHPSSAILTIISPGGGIIQKKLLDIPVWTKNQFVYPIQFKMMTPELSEEGWYTIKLTLAGPDSIESEERILVINPLPEPDKTLTLGILCHEPEFLNQINKFPGITATSYIPGEDYDVVVASTRLLHGWRSEVDSTREIHKTEDDILYHTESWGYWRNLEYLFSDLPSENAQVTIRLAEVTLKNQGDRIMSVAINDDTVLNNLDIVEQAGGPNVALDTVFTVKVVDGRILITIPKLTVNYAKFSAIKIEAGDTVIAINCGGKKPYKDKSGLIWDIYHQQINLNSTLLESIHQGSALLLLPDGEEAAEAYGKKLDTEGVLSYFGHVGGIRQSWMGAWFFVRKHPVFSGLPVDQAMKSYYQAPTRGSDGLLIDGDNIQVFTGYGRDHDRNIGAASFTVTHGKGKILWHSLPGMVTGLINEGSGLQPEILKRLLSNSIHYLVNEDED